MAVHLPLPHPAASSAGALGDLEELARSAFRQGSIERTWLHALAALRRVVPYDLAALYELEGETLVLRVAEGRLAVPTMKGHRLPLDRFPTIQRALTTRQPLVLEEHDHEKEGDPYDGVLDLPHEHSCMVMPLYGPDRALGLITLDAVACGQYAESTIALCNVYAQLVSVAMVFAQRTAELETARALLEERNRLLVEETGGSDIACRRIDASASPLMREVVRLARQVAITDSPVILHGETGTGKEVLAQALHAWSPRHRGPLVKLNCAAIPENLVESELFGHVKGAFSGAARARPGRFLAASGGTLFLDEIGDMPLAAQTKLLRAIQEKSFEPVGSDETISVDVRIIAASHVDLREAARDGRFREDLYYRLAVFPLAIPPLRDRPEDIVALASEMLTELALRDKRGPWILSGEAKAALEAETWPGNVRQLRNTIERATIVQAAGRIDVAHLGLAAPVGERLAREHVERSTTETARRGAAARSPQDAPLSSLKAQERTLVERALAKSNGKIYGRTGAAALLGMPPTTLQSKLRKLGLR